MKPFVALTPSNTDDTRTKREQTQAAQDEALLREVDDAYRQGQYADFAKRFGKPLLALLVIGLAAFGGYLYWEHVQQQEMEARSEKIVSALDQLQAGNFDTASKTLDSVVTSGDAGASSLALMLQADIAAKQGKTEDAAKQYAKISADASAPQELRNLATIRELSLTFDNTDPAKVIDRLKSLAAPGNPWFGSAGELVAMAYLKQGKKAEAGALFAQIAQSEDVPATLRARTRQMAGLLGVDAVGDPEKLLSDKDSADAAAPVDQ